MSFLDSRRKNRAGRPKSEGAKPPLTWECLCLECGISNVLELAGQTLETPGSGGEKILANIFCSACGGPLLVRGQAGAEPFYDTR